MENVTIGADVRFTYLGHSAFMLVFPPWKEFYVDFAFLT